MIDLAEARAVKAAAFALLSSPELGRAHETIWDDARYRDLDWRNESPSRAVAPLALGLVWAGRSGYRLAARVQRESRSAVAALDWLHGRGHGEVDVQVVGEIRALSSNARRVRPLQRGLSIGCDGSTGTLGAFVTDRATGHGPMLLSNNHVLARLGKAGAGANVLQPSLEDGGDSTEPVAQLLRSVPLDRRASNSVDVAVAMLARGTTHDLVNPRRVTGVVEGIDQAVEKWGRTTGHTEGQITAFDLDGIKVTYEDGHEYLFGGQLEMGGPGLFARGGDSGSLITTMDGTAVGLLFASADYGGPSGNGLAYANPIEAVLALGGVDLVI